MTTNRTLRTRGCVRMALAAAFLAVCVPNLTGCVASNRIVGHRIEQSGQWFDELGITGHLNDITVLRGSRLNKISIIGDGNFVVVEEGVTLGKVEIWGANNFVSVPDVLKVRKNVSGSKSMVVPRPAGAPLPQRRVTPMREPPRPDTMYEPDEDYYFEPAPEPEPAPAMTPIPRSSQASQYQPGISPAEPRPALEPGVSPPPDESP